MPRAYSLDLRSRVIAAREAGDRTRAQVARQFDVSEATLYDWLHRWRSDGVLHPRPQRQGRISQLDRRVLQALVDEQKDWTLAEYARAYEERTGRRYSLSRICTALQELRLTRKERRYAPRNTSSPTSRPSA
jgi:transposase